jgi:hypothetical protein
MAQRVFILPGRYDSGGAVNTASVFWERTYDDDAEFLLIPAEDAAQIRRTLTALIAIPGATMPGQIEEVLKLLDVNNRKGGQ